MPDFNALEPKKDVTDPKGLGADREYPRHVHQWAGTDDHGHVLLNDYLVVTSDQEKADALTKGWSLQPVLIDPATKAAKSKA